MIATLRNEKPEYFKIVWLKKTQISTIKHSTLIIND